MDSSTTGSIEVTMELIVLLMLLVVSSPTYFTIQK